MSSKKKPINLALQGGGAHGAFAWGVLDQILEDGRLEIEGISGTSAGAMNACAYSYGKYIGGPEKAREILHEFWWNIHKAGEKYGVFKRTPWDDFMPNSDWLTNCSPTFFMFDTLTRMISPYQFNPFDFNPLRDVLEKTIDFEALRKCKCTKLFISATHVQSGKVRVFNADQLSIDVAMASACLPFLFKAVEIEGEDFWDGGYMGNPSLFPLFYDTDSRDIMIVHINPIEREETPTTAQEIMNRVNEISFNSSLLKEMRAIAFVKKLIDHEMIKDEYRDDFKDVLVHSIRTDEVMKELSVASKFESDWDFLTGLRDQGRECTAAWLDKNFDKIGKQDTVDLHGEFLYSPARSFEKKYKTKKGAKAA